MNQARRTWHFARSARQGEAEKNKAALYLFSLLPSSRVSRKMARSPRLAHKAPVCRLS